MEWIDPPPPHPSYVGMQVIITLGHWVNPKTCSNELEWHLTIIGQLIQKKTTLGTHFILTHTLIINISMRDGVIPPKFMRCTHDGPPRLGCGNMITAKTTIQKYAPKLSAHRLTTFSFSILIPLTVCAAHAVTAGDVRVYWDIFEQRRLGSFVISICLYL